MSYGKIQEKEISTIKSRTYKLNLSDADVIRLAEKALNYNMTASELLENFIGDLVCGTYSNGSDEREYISMWAERCWFASEPAERNMTNFFFGCDPDPFYEFIDIEKIQENIKDWKVEVEKDKEKIKHPGDKWKDIVRYNSKKEAVPVYSCIEEYVEEIKEDLELNLELIKAEEEQLESLKKRFADYMGDKPYSWDEQLAECKIWYKVNVENVIDEQKLFLKENVAEIREKIIREINECAKTGDSHVNKGDKVNCYIKLSDVESIIKKYMEN